MAAVITLPPSPFHSIPSFSASLSLHLYLCSTSLPHSSVCRLGRHALSASAAWLLAQVQHRSVPLVRSPPPFSLCLPPWGLLASPLPWLLLRLPEQWSRLTLRCCAAAALLPLCLTHTPLCWIITTESARDSDRTERHTSVCAGVQHR